MKHLFLAFLYLISILPFPIIYGISSLIYLVLRYGISYRKDVILANLQQAFPNKTQAEIQQIMNQFYKNYIDVFMESVKLLTMSSTSLLKLISIKDNIHFSKLQAEDKGAIILTGHRGNFEMAGQYLSLVLSHSFYGAYKPFKSKNFEYVWHKIRHNFKMKYIPAKQVSRFLIQHAKEGLYLAFLNDQSPTTGDQHCWVNFLNKEAIFFTGPEKLATKLELPVYFMDMICLSRGKYEIIVEQLSAQADYKEEYPITKKYVQLLEKAILNNPYGWLWSHRRWKHLRNNQER